MRRREQLAVGVRATDEADGGAPQTCSPGGPNDTNGMDETYIINLFCGTG